MRFTASACRSANAAVVRPTSCFCVLGGGEGLSLGVGWRRVGGEFWARRKTDLLDGLGEGEVLPVCMVGRCRCDSNQSLGSSFPLASSHSPVRMYIPHIWATHFPIPCTAIAVAAMALEIVGALGSLRAAKPSPTCM